MSNRKLFMVEAEHDGRWLCCSDVGWPYQHHHETVQQAVCWIKTKKRYRDGTQAFRVVHRDTLDVVWPVEDEESEE